MRERARRLTRATRIELDETALSPCAPECNEATVMSPKIRQLVALIGRSLARPRHIEFSIRLCPSPEPGDNGPIEVAVMRRPA